VPSTLDFGQLSETHPYTGLPTKENSAEYLYYICSTLVTSQAKHGGWQERNSGYIPRCSKYLRKVHAQYNLLLDYMVEAGILLTDGIFMEGIKCTGYKFAPKYDGVALKEVTINTYILNKGIRNQHNELIKHHKKQLTGYGYLLKWYDKHKLRIDKEGALKWVGKYEEHHLQEIIRAGGHKEEKKKKQLVNICSSLKSQIDRIYESSYDCTDFSVDEFGERLHGIFTYLMKELRHFVTYDGQPLVSIDIKNSQPYFSTLLLDSDFWKSKKSQSNKIRLGQVAPELYKVCMSDGITLSNSSKRLIQCGITAEQYKHLVEDGRLYEYLLEELPKRLNSVFLTKHGHRVAKRDSIKKEMLRIMYSRNNVTNREFYAPSKAFESLFPDVARTFRVIKKNDYKLLPKILQRVESHVVLKIICGRIAAEKPNLPIFTIHDSIVTTVGNEDYVKQVMLSVLQEKVGAAPRLELQYWQPESAYKDLPGIEKEYICFEDIEHENNIMEQKD